MNSKRIVVEGTFSVGKSTLIHMLSKILGLPVTPDFIRLNVEKYRTSGDGTKDIYDQLPLNRAIAVAVNSLRSLLEYERTTPNYISDSGSVTLLATLFASAGKYHIPLVVGKLPESILIAHARNHYTNILYLPIEIPLEPASTRGSESDRRAIDGYITSFLNMHQLPYHTISGTIDERVHYAQELLSV
ncbi:MAG: AAA family ATPase [archaeon]